MRSRLAVLFALLGGCAPAGTPPAVTPHDVAPRFELALYGGGVGVIYDYAQLEPAVDRVIAGATPLLVLHETDLERVEAGPAPARRLQLVLTAAASARARATLAAALEGAPFVVTLDGRRRYVGVVYTPMGAAAIATPILSTDAERDGHVVVDVDETIGQGALAQPGVARIDAPELRAALGVR